MRLDKQAMANEADELRRKNPFISTGNGGGGRGLYAKPSITISRLNLNSKLIF